MKLVSEPYLAQTRRWPARGRHLLAQFDEASIVVYQAYSPEIGRSAAAIGHFAPPFLFGRMSWIKPNFLWMMNRNGWGTKDNQQITLAVRIHRRAFDEILELAVHSAFDEAVYGSHANWKQELERSDVRLQWDPDHDPAGAPLERRAIQLGLRGEVLQNYANRWIIEIQDISAFVEQQRANAASGCDERLLTPREDIYRVSDPAVARKLGVDEG